MSSNTTWRLIELSIFASACTAFAVSRQGDSPQTQGRRVVLESQSDRTMFSVTEAQVEGGTCALGHHKFRQQLQEGELDFNDSEAEWRHELVERWGVAPEITRVQAGAPESVWIIATEWGRNWEENFALQRKELGSLEALTSWHTQHHLTQPCLRAGPHLTLFHFWPPSFLCLNMSTVPLCLLLTRTRALSQLDDILLWCIHGSDGQTGTKQSHPFYQLPAFSHTTGKKFRVSHHSCGIYCAFASFAWYSHFLKCCYFMMAELDTQIWEPLI